MTKTPVGEYRSVVRRVEVAEQIHEWIELQRGLDFDSGRAVAIQTGTSRKAAVPRNQGRKEMQYAVIRGYDLGVQTEGKNKGENNKNAHEYVLRRGRDPAV